jgi:lipopolysaccharide biosynthesis protein
MTPIARVFAFYLPQFHPIPENNDWWGPGFTEWTNVAKARPLYRGHIQPRLPRDLGFYDLRVPELREQQAQLAQDCGVEGFCYWHYWFGHGRRILQRPFQEVLDSGQPDFPFCLAWANQSWTGIWAGNPKSTLIEQEYPGRTDEIAHFNWARTAFEDPRYQRVDGKPVFVIFAPHDLPSTADFIDHWRELAHKAGFPGLYFVAIVARYKNIKDRYRDAMFAPFDAVTPLTPQDFLEDLSSTLIAKVGRRIQTRNVSPRFGETGTAWQLVPARYNYRDVVERALHDIPNELRCLPGVLPGWDNTPRSGRRGVVFDGATPELFAQYLDRALKLVKDRPQQHRIVFLKAWNEWAEGNYVEPDAINGHAYLDVLRDALLSGGQEVARPVKVEQEI